MIVRISTVGQFRLTDEQVAALNALDLQVVEAIDRDDEPAFRELFHRLIELIEQQGERIGHDELEASDSILPPPDASLEEARGEMSHDGLFPG